MSRFMLCAIGLMLAVACAAPVAAVMITNVVETGGDNEATDTITAKWSGVSWTVGVAGEPVPGAAVGDTYTAGTFGNSAPAFVDRLTAILTIPPTTCPYRLT